MICGTCGASIKSGNQCYPCRTGIRGCGRWGDSPSPIPPQGGSGTAPPQVIDGVGADAPIIVNERGGRQSNSPYRCDLLPPQAVLQVAKVLKHGADKYTPKNWHAIAIGEHINHAMVHLLAYLAEDRQDDHLGHAACRLMMALDQQLSGRCNGKEAEETSAEKAAA